MVRYSQSSCTSTTGDDLVAYQYLPDTTIKAALCFHHGLQEHAGRYKEIFTTMADAGIAVYTYDAIGHGNSGGHRAYVPTFSNLVDDFELICNKAVESLKAENASSASLFIAGHSLGGLVAATTCLKDQSRWCGLLMSSPAVDVEWTPMLRFQAKLGNILAAIVPKARIVPAVAPELMNRDPAKVEKYKNDPLNYVGPVAARTANESLKAFKDLNTRRQEFALPVYAHHGTDDKCTSFPATKAFVDAVSSRDKTFVPIEGGYHEVMFESCGPEIVDAWIKWILARTNENNTAKM